MPSRFREAINCIASAEQAQFGNIAHGEYSSVPWWFTLQIQLIAPLLFCSLALRISFGKTVSARAKTSCLFILSWPAWCAHATWWESLELRRINRILSLYGFVKSSKRELFPRPGLICHILKTTTRDLPPSLMDNTRRSFTSCAYPTFRLSFVYDGGSHFLCQTWIHS